MYTNAELAAIDRKYFVVILADGYDVAVMSKNTHHMWRLHCVELSDGDLTVLFHSHKSTTPYHFQRHERSMGTAIRYIRKHDIWQMNGRKPIRKSH